MEPSRNVTVKGLNIGAVSRLTGVEPETLRAWERRYGAIVPYRTPGGHRAYSWDDVERVRLLAQLVQKGHSIGSIAGWERARLEKLLCSKDSAPTELCEENLEVFLPPLVEHVRAFRFSQLRLMLQRLSGALSLKAYLLQIVVPLQHRIGSEVAEGRVSIAQEHAATHLVRNSLCEHFERLLELSEGPPAFVLTTPEGDLHEIGILVAAILCLAHGFSVLYLGAAVPVRELWETTLRVGGRYVLLGVKHVEGVHYTERLAGYLEELRRGLGGRAEILVGGDALPPRLGTRSGFGHFATLESLCDALATGMFGPCRTASDEPSATAGSE